MGKDQSLTNKPIDIQKIIDELSELKREFESQKGNQQDLKPLDDMIAKLTEWKKRENR